jgi:hypothetical protein
MRFVPIVLGITGIAVLCVSSVWLAAAVGILTAIVVVIDVLAYARPVPDAPKPRRLSVDLTRRR